MLLNLISIKKHHSIEGLLEIVALKEHFPKGLPTNLKLEFPNFVPIVCPSYTPNLSFINLH